MQFTRPEPRLSSAGRPFRLALRLLLLSLALGAPEAHAVVIASGDGTGNTEAPADDPGFAHVGNSGLSVVYLRNGWVVTANHVPGSGVRLRGVLHRFIEGSKHQLTNPRGFLRPDLAVFKIYPTPALPPMAIRKSPPSLRDPVVLAGRGHTRGAPVEWNGFAGWGWLSSGAVRWGTNLVYETDILVSAKKTDRTRAFTTRFDPQPATEHEAQAAPGDSGGAAFIKNDGQWELAGVLFATNGHPGQPDKLSLEGNLTLIADLSYYRDEILGLTASPACNDGLDDDGDGLTDYPADPGCSSATDQTETTGALPCDDGRDNDADRGVDYRYDFGCDSSTDQTEH